MHPKLMADLQAVSWLAKEEGKSTGKRRKKAAHNDIQYNNCINTLKLFRAALVQQ